MAVVIDSSTNELTYYAQLPKQVNLKKDTDTLYIDVNQLYNSYDKGFTLLSDTEVYPVDRYSWNTPAWTMNDGTKYYYDWVDPYYPNSDGGDDLTHVYETRDGQDFINFESSDPTLATIPSTEHTTTSGEDYTGYNDSSSVVTKLANVEPHTFNFSYLDNSGNTVTNTTQRRYIKVTPDRTTSKYGTTVIKATNTDTYLDDKKNTNNTYFETVVSEGTLTQKELEEIDKHHAYAGNAGGFNLRIVPGEDIPPSVVSKGDHSLAVNIYGEVWAWGLNDEGQLGDGTTYNRSYPTQVMLEVKDANGNVTGYEPMRDVSIVAVGDKFSVALTRAGKIYAWGQHDVGQLGNGVDPARLASGAKHFLRPTEVTIDESRLATGEKVANIVAGANHVLAVTTEGQLFAWGSDSDGQLGIKSSNDYAFSPVQVKGYNGAGNLKDIILIAAGAKHSLAVATNGDVWSWGDNTYGQLGQGVNDNDKYKDKTTPDYVLSSANAHFSGVDGISAGEYFSVATTSDPVTSVRTVYSWGLNNEGQLGIGRISTSTSTNANTKAVQLSEATPISVKTEKIDPLTGKVVYDANNKPVLEELHKITMVAGGKNHVIAMSTEKLQEPKMKDGSYIYDDDGNLVMVNVTPEVSADKIYMWGENTENQYDTSIGEITLTSGTYDTRSYAHQITELSKVNPEQDSTMTAFSSVTAGWNHSVFLTNNGYLWALGDNEYGQLGDMTETDSETPVRVGFKAEDILNFNNVTVSRYNGTGEARTTETLVDPAQIDISDKDTVTFDTSELKAYHHAAFNLRLLHSSDATTEVTNNVTSIKFYSSNPDVATVNETTGVVTPVAGRYGTATITAYAHKETSVSVTEDDGNGGTTTVTKTQINNVFIAETVITVAGYNENSKKIKAVPQTASGENFTVALKSDGSVWAWGADTYGQLGDHDSAGAEKAYPVEVTIAVASGTETTYTPLTNIKAIAAGGAHALALTRDGKIYAWGDNYYGQLGNGESGYVSGTTHKLSRTAVLLSDIDSDVLLPEGSALPAEFVAIAAATSFQNDAQIREWFGALAKDGSVWTWGYNANGRLGHGDYDGSHTKPVKVMRGSSAGMTQKMLDDDGNEVKIYVRDSSGEIVMIDDPASTSTPKDQIAKTRTLYEDNIYLEDIIAIAAHGNTAMAVKLRPDRSVRYGFADR